MDLRTQKIGDCHLDLGRRGVIRDGELLRVEPRDFHVLVHLVDQAPNLVSSRALLRRAWRNKVVGDNALHQSIGRLRRILGDDARTPSYIHTMAKMGYQFIAAVTPLKRLRGAAMELSPMAVLPFRDYSRQPSDPYVVDGLCFEICHELIQHGAQVVSLDRAAGIQRYGFTDLGAAERVGARTVLGGSLVVSGGRLRVTANLSDVERERQVWSAKLDFAAGQILDLHTLLSECIVKSIYQRLGVRKGPLANPATCGAEPYQVQSQLGF